jgi:uncharacterized membrane-anchored protein
VYYLCANPVLTFWIAYILTRPLGASLGDMLSQAREYGGLGFGRSTRAAPSWPSLWPSSLSSR